MCVDNWVRFYVRWAGGGGGVISRIVIFSTGVESNGAVGIELTRDKIHD